MKVEFKINEIEKVVNEHLLPRLEKNKIFAFQGPLGAGKTTMIKAFLKACGITDIVTSPTFTYVNSYKNKKGQTFNHFDLYRLPTLESFLNLGFDEYFSKSLEEGNSFNLIEWPEVIKPMLEEKELKQATCFVNLNYEKNNLDIRTLEIS